MKPSAIRERLRRLGDAPRFRLREWDGDPMFDELEAAAVLVPLTERNGEIEVVLTKRSTNLAKHPGQVSFPGGRQDDTDESLVHTALRESHEEISLRPSDVEMYGALMSMPTITGYDVTTFVGEFASPYDLYPNPDEIEEMFLAPLVELADPGVHRVEHRSWNGRTFPVHYFDWGDHVVWGATGFMLDTLLGYLDLR